MKSNKPKLTLAQPAAYQIKVPGHLEASWTDWIGQITLTVESGDDGQAVTTITSIVDQAALHGLLRRLYSLGLPLISVICVGDDSEDEE